MQKQDQMNDHLSHPNPIFVSSLHNQNTTTGFQSDIDLQTDSYNSFQSDYGHHLVLHFDVNETILVGDEAGGDSRYDSLNKMIAKSAFVRMANQQQEGQDQQQVEEQQDGASRRSYEETSQIEPRFWWNGALIKNTYHPQDQVPPLYTGWVWPKGCCPYYRTMYKNRAKDFVLHHGAPYASTLHKIDDILRNATTISSTAVHYHTDSLAKKQDQDQDHQIQDQSLSFSSFSFLSHMIPSFFDTLVKLSHRSQKFTLVFRTMGTDLPQIAQAISQFATGKHPAYPNYFNPDLVLHPHDLVQGRWTQHQDPHRDHTYQLWRGEKIIADGDQQVLDFIHKRSVCGIQDDYQFWKSKGFQPWAGKPVWIPRPHNSIPLQIDQNTQHSPSRNLVQHILLDDNIHNLQNDSIASVKKQMKDGSFQTLNAAEIQNQQGIHLIRVPTIAPILQPSWFIQQIDAAQQRFVQQHKVD